eukprot:5205513-Alexandrium_andersonii.AAC.1
MPEQTEEAKKAEAKAATKKSGDKNPFVKQSELKDVFYLFCDSKTKLLPLNDVPYVLRATGPTLVGSCP